MPHQVQLLECYRNTPPEALVCVEQGFQGSIRPMPDICRAERDELVGCAAPRVMECIAACRRFDEADPVLAPEGAPVAAAESCPSSPVPCERLCWAIDGAFADDDGGDDLEDLPALGAGADLDTLAAALVGCARTGARDCWESTLAGEPAAERVSWTSLFFECAAPFLTGPVAAPLSLVPSAQ